TIQAYRVKRAWSEAQATWNEYVTGSAWGTSGAGGADDIEATPIGSVVVATSATAGTVVTINLDADAVQEWIDGDFTNNGLLLKSENENKDEFLFASSENATTAWRPVLEITLASDAGGSASAM